jgi:hypothetical protein
MADKLRPLTGGEIELARSVFGDRIRYERVRLSDGCGLNPIAFVALRQPGTDAITIRRTIYFGGHYHPDFAIAGTIAQGLLLHEMTHIRQWAELGAVPFLIRYVREFLSTGGDRKAMYQYKPGDPFPEARIEAQAQMVQDYYLNRADKKPLADLETSLAGSGCHGH